jgi:hypothetical protein
MIIRDRSYPHPVLAPFRDDVNPNKFVFAVAESHDADNYYLDVSFDQDNPTLTSLVAAGKAAYSVHLECKRNFYREIFTFTKKTDRITIRASELVGRVEVSGFIKAQQTIAGYKIEGSHSDYGDADFQIREGDVLAVAASQVFDAYVDYDPLRRISSILTIRRSDTDEEGPMKLDTSGDRIVATLSQKDYDRYTDLKADPNLGPLLANQVVVPALLEGVHEIQGTSETEFEMEMSKRWFRSVYKKLDESGIKIRNSDTSAVEAVQSILKLPLRRSLEGLIQMNPLDENQ